MSIAPSTAPADTVAATGAAAQHLPEFGREKAASRLEDRWSELG
jgi:hypothetical protein